MEESNIEIKQSQRAELRSRFLQVLKCMEDKNLTIDTYQGATVQCKFRSIDYDINNMHVSNLQTPIGTMPEALLRYSDLLSIKFNADY
jgi:gem associated protein 7